MTFFNEYFFSLENIFFCLFETILKCSYTIFWIKNIFLLQYLFIFLLQYCVPKYLVWIRPNTSLVNEMFLCKLNLQCLFLICVWESFSLWVVFWKIKIISVLNYRFVYVLTGKSTVCVKCWKQNLITFSGKAINIEYGNIEDCNIEFYVK